MGQGVHHRPGDVGVAGGVGARGAVSDLAAGGSAALDGQEGGGDVVPTGVPFDAAGLDRVLGFEHQRVFGFEAVVDRRGTREEVAHQIEYAVADAGDVDADVLHVEALAQFFDLPGLVGERVAAPGVFLQDAEFAARFQRRRHHHAGRVVAGAAGVVADPHRGVAEGALGLGRVVFPQGQVGVAALQIRQVERALAAVDKLAKVELVEDFIGVFQA